MKKKMWRGKPKPPKPLVFLDEGYLYASTLPSGSVWMGAASNLVAK